MSPWLIHFFQFTPLYGRGPAETENGKKANCVITVIAVQSISVNEELIKKSYFVGETLDTSAMKIQVNYSNGDSAEVYSGFTYEPSSFTAPGTQTVSLKYKKRSVTFDVTVDRPGISISSNNDIVTKKCNDTESSANSSEKNWRLTLPKTTTTPPGNSVKWTVLSGNANIKDAYLEVKEPGIIEAKAYFEYCGYKYEATYTVTLNVEHNYENSICKDCGEKDPNINWVSTWATAEENFTASSDRVPNDLNGTTVRQIIRVTTSGSVMKLKFSNVYGYKDVVVHSLHVAKQVQADKSTIDVSTDTVVTVGGSEEFIIPKGKTIETDPFDFQVNALENIAVSMYFGDAPNTAAEITGHRGARATTYQVSGNKVSDETINATKKILSWYFLCDASLISPRGSRAVVCFGDSITDGYGTDADYLGKKPDSYTRWTDYFAKRLQANEKTRDVSVLNEGIGANAMFGAYPTDAGKDRFARDLLEHEGVKYVIILFGVNDLQKLSNTSKFAQMKAEYEKMIALAHQNGIKVYAAPILPFGTSRDYYSAASEQVRTMINDWFRSEESGVDAIIDFESAVADPNNPKNLQERYTHSDGLHPYDGYDVMADAIDLGLFE